MKYAGLFIIIFCFFSVQGNAQGSIAIKAGVSIPFGDFVNKNPANYEPARAGTGFSLGTSFRYQLFNSGLGLTAGLDFIQNPVSQEFKDETRSEYNKTFGDNYDITFQRYIAIPISLGIEYRFNNKGNFSPFLMGGLSVNYFKITDLDIDAVGLALNYSAEPSVSAGFHLGLGIGIKQNIDIGLTLYNLGAFMVEVESKSILGVNKDTYDYKVDFGTLFIGYRF